ncbi:MULTISPECIES: hypothetical protein [unclassified Streptomyces]|uniref:hypothetical protein n=1 Tax=unclassified Streptomyces TaxID=2593676 RepID=UPI003D92FBB3
MLQQDSIYARRPWSSAREQQVTDALREWTDIPADAARRMKPPIPNIGRIPPRFGYAQHVPGIGDIARLDDVYPGVASTTASPSPGIPRPLFPHWE